MARERGVVRHDERLPTRQSCATCVYAMNRLSLPMVVTPPPLRGAAIHGGELAEHVAIADLEPRGLAVVLEVLRRVADRRELEDLVAGADARRALDDRVRTDPGPGADAARRPDDRVRAHRDVRGQLRLAVKRWRADRCRSRRAAPLAEVLFGFGRDHHLRAKIPRRRPRRRRW